jgi:hypothetical protein
VKYALQQTMKIPEVLLLPLQLPIAYTHLYDVVLPEGNKMLSIAWCFNIATVGH